MNISNPNGIDWDYTGIYDVTDVSGNMYLQTLTLDYDFFDNENFELSVNNEQSISLFHRSSEIVYEFTGRGYIQFLRDSGVSGRRVEEKRELKKRKQKTFRNNNPRVSKRC